MKQRILIMGLPGSGKTYFAEHLKRYLEQHGTRQDIFGFGVCRHTKTGYIDTDDANAVDFFGQQLQGHTTGCGHTQVDDDNAIECFWVGLLVHRIADVFKQFACDQCFRIERHITDGAAGADRLFADATDALIRWQLASKPGVLPPYDRALLRRELELFPEWYLQRHRGLTPSAAQRRMLDSVFDGPALPTTAARWGTYLVTVVAVLVLGHWATRRAATRT